MSRRAFGGTRFVPWLFAVDARTAAWAATLGAAVVLMVGAPLAAALNIWIDEAFTLHTTGAGPFAAWAQSIAFEAQPPFYFLIEAAWRMLDERSVLFARLPSVLFAAAAVATIVGAAHRIAPRIPPFIVALLTVTNPLLIWAAVEMRVYALVVFVGAVLTWTFFEGFLASRPSRRARTWYVICAIAGLYTQYYVGFLLVAHAFTLLAARRRALRAFAVATAIVAVAFAPFSRVAMMHVQARGEFVSRVTFVHAFHEIANAMFVFVLPHDAGWFGATKLAGFALAAALICTLFAFGRPAVPAEPARAVAVQWIICVAVFSLVFYVSGVPLDPPKYLIVAAPLTLLTVFVFISSLTRMRALAGSVAVAVFAVFASTLLWTQYRPPLAKQGEWQRVAATLSADDRATPIAVFPAELALPLGWYLPVATIPIAKPMPFTVDYVRATALTNESEVARVLDPVREQSRRLWIVTSGECRQIKLRYYDYHCGYLEAYLNRRYRVVRRIGFRDALARLYTRFPDVSAD